MSLGGARDAILISTAVSLVEGLITLEFETFPNVYVGGLETFDAESFVWDNERNGGRWSEGSNT